MIFVQLQEALRLIEEDDVPHQRLALLLLDNASEVIMQRMCEAEISLNHLYGEALELMRDHSGLSDADRELFEKAQQEFVSNSQRKKRHASISAQRRLSGLG